MENSIYLLNDLTLKDKLKIWFKFINSDKDFEEWYDNLTKSQLNWLSVTFD